MKRFRDLRKDENTRNHYAEVNINAEDLIYPYFVIDGNSKRDPIKSLHGIDRFTIDRLLEDLKETVSLGINKILLFGVIDESLKNEWGTASYSEGNLVARAVAAVKNEFPGLIVITDVCLCGYTSHGHCGLLEGETIDNDSTLPLLAKMALTHAAAGADFVAPSAMMDGQVDAIRKILNENKLYHTKILSYSAKFASGFYGPFRDAAQSAPSFGDRKTYQMDYRTIGQSIGEVAADIIEGADWVMVKPAHTYLDVIQRIKSALPEIKLAAYHVSGEYMMIKAAAAAGLMDETKAMTEALYAIKRAGADYIITYYAKDYQRIHTLEMEINQYATKYISNPQPLKKGL
jgi:porphobilinogen synthase